MNFNPRMRFVWLAEAFLAVQLLFLWALVIYTIFPMESELIEGIPNRVLIMGTVVALSVAVLVAVAVGAELYHRNFEYDFTDDALVVRKGVVRRKEYIIPYKSIDSAKVLRSGVHALDQVFGLTCIQVRANGRSVIIPGIAEPELFLRRLMAHVEGNESIKNSEIYMSDREILLKLVAGLRALSAKFDQHIAEQKKAQTSRQHTEFVRSYAGESRPIIDIKTFADIKKAEKGVKKRRRKKKGDGDE